MSWLQKLLPPRIKAATGVARKTMPEGLWVKCPSCEAVLYRTDLEKNLNVCPKCAYHSRVGARERIDQLLDPEGRFFAAFDRDAGPTATLSATLRDGRTVETFEIIHFAAWTAKKR